MNRFPAVPSSIIIAAVFFSAIAHATLRSSPACELPRLSPQASVEYIVSLAGPRPNTAFVIVVMRDQGGRRILNMPVWNALYQVRNFAANIEDVRAEDENGTPVAVVHTGTSEWQVSAPEGCIAVTYTIHLDTPGPFGSQLNSEHAFLNWAMVLMYLPDLRDKPVALRLDSIPFASVRDLHLCRMSSDIVPGDLPANSAHPQSICLARNYDELVDSPIEASNMLQESSFQQDGATYHILVHGYPADFDMAKLEGVLQKITHAGVEWMQDRPYDEYTFLYHFPQGPAGGGMEHAYGTAIDVSSGRLGKNLEGVADVSAHEFFHLWNVKRIRPQSLEPINYQREQDTSALWFSEGVTSTVADLLRVRAGLLRDQQYLDEVGRIITGLQQRPAHAWQSAEDSSLDAWFEGNAFYRSPARSVSYYNKGELLGILLDLRIRALTSDTRSLRDLFHWMNEHYAKQHRYFPDSRGVEEAAGAITGKDFDEFFQEYVRGTREIPYNDFFQFVGLRLVANSTTVAWPGFVTTTNLGGQPEVVDVEPGSDAQKAGILKGDRVVSMNGNPVNGSFEDDVERMRPGDTVTMTIVNRRGERNVKLRLASRREQVSELQDLPSVTSAQHAHRTAWIHGEDEGGGAP